MLNLGYVSFLRWCSVVVPLVDKLPNVNGLRVVLSLAQFIVKAMESFRKCGVGRSLCLTGRIATSL